MAIRCPHMLVACGYFNYIFSINSGALGMHSLNGVPDFHIEHNTSTFTLCKKFSLLGRTCTLADHYLSLAASEP